MKLIDLLSIIDENMRVRIMRDAEEVAYYDGRDSIPEELNDCRVESLHAWKEMIVVSIR